MLVWVKTFCAAYAMANLRNGINELRRCDDSAVSDSPAKPEDGTAPKRKSRLVMNASSLASATAITSLLGVLFWAITARLYDPAGVGVATAQISSATLLAAFAQLGLGLLIVRYLPRAGLRSKWLVKRTYVVVTSASIVIGLGFVLLGFGATYLTTWVSVVLFVVAVPVLALFVIQDQTLLALGAAPWVPTENALFGIAKIAFLPVLAGATIVSGIFAAWILPAAAAVAVVTWYIFRRRVPRNAALHESVNLPARRQLWPQVAKQYLTGVFGQVAVLGMPLVIIDLLGATASGYFAIAWLINSSFGALLGNVVSAFVYDVRAGHPPTRHSIRHLILMVGFIGGIGGLVTVVAAPVILTIIAPGYAQEATTLLRLIGISVPLEAIWIIMLQFWWLENRMGWCAIGNAIASGLALATAALLCPSLGIAAAGIGSIAGFGVMAVVSTPLMISRVKIIAAGGGSKWVNAESASS